MIIDIACGSGGKSTADLIERVFAKYLANPMLDRREDAAVLEIGAGKLAFTTDSYVVTPLFFKGGDIGKLAVCGTVNDLAVMGAESRWLSAGFIIETGTDEDTLSRIAESMGKTARDAGVVIAAADTKVIEGNGGVYINTSGVGILPAGRDVGVHRISAGDSIIVSGDLGDHHACILSTRMKIENGIQSDCAPLNGPIGELFKEGIAISCMRDITRGGLGTVLSEIAGSARHDISIVEESIPVNPTVAGFCGILGLDPVYMGNEGKFVLICAPGDEQRSLAVLKKDPLSRNACLIGYIGQADPAREGRVTMTTKIGGRRNIGPLIGEGLPRIC